MPKDFKTVPEARPAALDRRRHLVLWLLAIVYTFNFLDRQVVSILQEPIRRELGLSDTQLGMLTGIAFAAFYTTFGLPLAWLADRARRVWIMAAACAVWSLFTAVCGLAGNFVQLALARVGVGIGEAGGSPPSYSLISDYFPPRERGRALAVYSLGAPAGSMIGAALAGGVAATYGWRAAFVAVGAPGVLLALLVLLLVREPVRGGLDPAQPESAAPSRVKDAVAGFFGNPVLLFSALAGSLSAFIIYAMLGWSPSFLIRVKHMQMAEVARYYSLLLGVTGFSGTLLSGWLVDKLGARDPRWYAWVPAIATALSLPFLIGFLWAPSWPLAMLFLAGPALLNNMYLAPLIAVVQNNSPPAQRALSSAILLFILNLVGLGGGPLFVGRLSDLAKPSFGEASLLVGVGGLVPIVALTVLAHIYASRWLGRAGRLAGGPAPQPAVG